MLGMYHMTLLKKPKQQTSANFVVFVITFCLIVFYEYCVLTYFCWEQTTLLLNYLCLNVTYE